MKYKKSLQEDWIGRESAPELGIQYWYQLVKCVDMYNLFSLDNLSEIKNKHYAILGYACEEGVRRNLGRLGAKNGPKAIREQLMKLAVHQKNVQIYDVGDVVCEQDEMEKTQEAFGSIVSKLLENGVIPIGLGGGHDMGYAHLSGISEFLGSKKEKETLGIINFDAHFDLRQVEGNANSGTPFRQFLEEQAKENEVGYFALGIQPSANTSSLFDFANSHKNVQYKCLDQLNYGNFPVPNAILWELTQFINNYENLYITIDLDGFSAAYAPGVSAPSAFGFTPDFVAVLLKHIAKSGKVVAFDVAEMNPAFDIDFRTAKLAAQLVDLIVNL